jgi:Arc/MetJ-type ribon-helix-helix transcriptional regulator
MYFDNILQVMASGKRKPYVTVTIPQELLDWLNSKVESREFANLAHGIELCLIRYKEAEERGERP